MTPIEHAIQQTERQIKIQSACYKKFVYVKKNKPVEKIKPVEKKNKETEEIWISFGNSNLNKD